MAKKSLETLKAEALALGIALTGQESYDEVSQLVNPKDPGAQVNPSKGELTSEQIAQIEKDSEIAKQKLKETQQPVEEKKYSREDVLKMFAEFKKELKKDDVAEEEEDGERKHTVRMSRFNNKFIIGLKNLNDDPYFPDRIVTSKDIFNDQTRQFVPHVTLLLDDASELTIPLHTIIEIKQSINCPLLETKQIDASVKYGTIEKQELKGESYQPSGTGEFVQGKQVKKKYSYIVQLPNREEPVEVGPEVVNW